MFGKVLIYNANIVYCGSILLVLFLRNAIHGICICEYMYLYVIDMH